MNISKMKGSHSYYTQLISAYVRSVMQTKEEKNTMLSKRLGDLNNEEHELLYQWAVNHSLDISLFECIDENGENMELMKKAFLAIRGIQPDNVLMVTQEDVAYTWAILDEFRYIPIMLADLKQKFISYAKAVHQGGVEQLRHRALHLNAPVPLEGVTEVFDVSMAFHLRMSLDELDQLIHFMSSKSKRFIFIGISIKELPNWKSDLRALFMKLDIQQIMFNNNSEYGLAIARK